MHTFSRRCTSTVLCRSWGRSDQLPAIFEGVLVQIFIHCSFVYFSASLNAWVYYMYFFAC